MLLQEGIGDTIRISLTPEPGGDRTREVIVAQEILQTMGLRAFTPMVSACPGCGRTTSTVLPGAGATSIQSYLRDADAGLEAQLSRRRGDARRGDGLRGERPGRIASTPTSASACPAPARVPVAPVYVDGEKTVTLKGERIAEEFQAIVEGYVQAEATGKKRMPDQGRSDVQKVKPALLRGFDQEYLPHEQLQFNALIDIIRRNFELYGFLPIETPSAERREVLTSKGGVEKEIYALTRLAEADDDEAATKGALRFDLTVPLARYVASTSTSSRSRSAATRSSACSAARRRSARAASASSTSATSTSSAAKALATSPTPRSRR